MNLFFQDLIHDCGKNEREKTSFKVNFFGLHIISNSTKKTCTDNRLLSGFPNKFRYKHGKFYRGICTLFSSYCLMYDGKESQQLFSMVEFEGYSLEKIFSTIISNLKQQRGRNSVHRLIIRHQR